MHEVPQGSKNSLERFKPFVKSCARSAHAAFCNYRGHSLINPFAGPCYQIAQKYYLCKP